MARGMWELYKSAPQYVLGFHGCTESVGEDVLAGKATLRPSTNDDDWLGEGIYFWEASPARAEQWAHETVARIEKRSGKPERPFVLGAFIDLGLCFKLFDSDCLAELAQAHGLLQQFHSDAKLPMPVNAGQTEDRLLRYLDRYVIEYMHALRAQARAAGSQITRYDTVRRGLYRGRPLYPGTSLTRKSHIQLAVRNPACIKGYFRPIARK